MARVVFPSIKNPEKMAFVLNSDIAWNADFYRNGDGCLDPAFRWFPTLGDGMTQHGSEVFVSVWDAADYIHSLIKFLQANPEHTRVLLAAVFAPIENHQIRFLSKIKPTEEKPHRYYFYGHRKTSASSEKQHDKRWRQIPEYFKPGTTPGIHLLYRLAEEHHNLLQRMWAYVSIDIWLSTVEGSDSYGAFEFGPTFGLYQHEEYDPERAAEVAEIRRSIEFLMDFYDAARQMERADYVVQSFERNVQYKRDDEAAKKAAAQAE